MRTYTHLTPHERTLIVELARQNTPITHIAKRLHRSEATVANILYEAGIFKDFDTSKFLTVSDICSRLKISHNPVYRIAKVLGIEPTVIYGANKFYFTPDDFEKIKNSTEYAKVLQHRLHKTKRPVKKRWPLTGPPRLCAECRFFDKKTRFCVQREITLSRLSTALSFHDCAFFEEDTEAQF